MAISLETFRAAVGQTRYGNRDIVVSGEGKNATARLGNFFFSQGKAVNNATMKAFKAALELFLCVGRCGPALGGERPDGNPGSAAAARGPVRPGSAGRVSALRWGCPGTPPSGFWFVGKGVRGFESDSSPTPFRARPVCNRGSH